MDLRRAAGCVEAAAQRLAVDRAHDEVDTVAAGAFLIAEACWRRFSRDCAAACRERGLPAASSTGILNTGESSTSAWDCTSSLESVGGPRAGASGGGPQPEQTYETDVVEQRMGWDLNPRAAFATAGFQDRCIQPLCHPSGFHSFSRTIVCRVLAEVYRACRPGRRTVAADKPPPPASGRGGFDCFPLIF